MELNEEKELGSITADFSKAVETFKQRTYPQAQTMFEQIIDQYKDSHFDRVLMVRNSSMVYRNICQSQINPVKIELTCDEDYLFDGIYFLNAGKLDKALERFHYLLEKEYADPYLYYLLAIIAIKKRETSHCISYLKKAIHKDPSYRIIAHNETNFDGLAEYDDFVSLVDSGI